MFFLKITLKLNCKFGTLLVKKVSNLSLEGTTGLPQWLLFVMILLVKKVSKMFKIGLKNVE